MKKILILILAFGLVLILNGCALLGGEEGEIKSDEEAKETLEDLTADLDELSDDLGDVEEGLG